MAIWHHSCLEDADQSRISGCLAASGSCMPSVVDEGWHTPRGPCSAVAVSSSSVCAEVSCPFFLSHDTIVWGQLKIPSSLPPFPRVAVYILHLSLEGLQNVLLFSGQVHSVCHIQNESLVAMHTIQGYTQCTQYNWGYSECCCYVTGKVQYVFKFRHYCSLNSG